MQGHYDHNGGTKVTTLIAKNASCAPVVLGGLCDLNAGSLRLQRKDKDHYVKRKKCIVRARGFS